MNKHQLYGGLPLISYHLLGQASTHSNRPLGKDAAISLSFKDDRYSPIESGMVLPGNLDTKTSCYRVSADAQ